MKAQSAVHMKRHILAPDGRAAARQRGLHLGGLTSAAVAAGGGVVGAHEVAVAPSSFQIGRPDPKTCGAPWRSPTSVDPHSGALPVHHCQLEPPFSAATQRTNQPTQPTQPTNNPSRCSPIRLAYCRHLPLCTPQAVNHHAPERMTDTVPLYSRPIIVRGQQCTLGAASAWLWRSCQSRVLDGVGRYSGEITSARRHLVSVGGSMMAVPGGDEDGHASSAHCWVGSA